MGEKLSEQPFLDYLKTLPFNRMFNEESATPEEWADNTAWRREKDRGALVSVRNTSQYGEYVRPLEGGRQYYRPSAEGKHLVEDVLRRLANAGFDVSGPNSPAKLFADSFGHNLGRGLSPSDALFDAYGGEWRGRGTPENRAMWPDQWSKDEKKPIQWEFEDMLGVRR